MRLAEQCYEHTRGTSAYNLPVKPISKTRNQWGTTYWFSDGTWFWQSIALGYRKWGNAEGTQATMMGGS